jgi:Tol biopolymer transport system component
MRKSRIRLFVWTAASFFIFIAIVILANTSGNLQITKAATNFYRQLFPEPLTGTILFVSNKSGNWDIYEMDLATKQMIDITNNPSDDMNPQVSPDGKTMVFYSNRESLTTPQKGQPTNQIYAMNLETKVVTQLTNDDSGNYDPTFSPDGNSILFKSTRDDGFGDIFIMNSDGTNQRNVTKGRNTTEEWDPVFSPNGATIYFVSRLSESHASDELFTMNGDGTNIVQLTQNTVADWYPAVNPKTGILLFISKLAASASDDLFISDTNGGNKTDITNLTGNDNDPAWNLDGTKIIFINDHDGNYNMFIMDSDGSGLQRVADIPGNELSPVFVPTPVTPTP